MAISGAIAFMPRTENVHLNVFIYAIIFVLVGIPCIYIWLKMGDTVADIIKSKRSNAILGYTLFTLMVLSIVTIWI